MSKKFIVRTIQQPSMYIGYIGDNKYGLVKEDNRATSFGSKKEAIRNLIEIREFGRVFTGLVEIVRVY